MRVLWISDSPETPSGFGNVTRFVCSGLAQRGHQVDILGWQATEPTVWQGCHIYPRGPAPLGADVIFGLLIRHRPDVVIALGDVWWMPFMASPHVRRQLELLKTPWVLYFPIDGDAGEGRLPASWIELLREVDIPVAMSAYGQRIVRAAGIDAELIPHGVDLSIFQPPQDRARAKAMIGAQDRFLILSDSRNQPRKLIPRLLDVIKSLAVHVPDVLLHLHTDPDDEFTRSAYYSYDVRGDVAYLGLEQHVRFSPAFSMSHGTGLPLEQLASYYQAADVHLLASSGEGFGLPTLQAAAAGAVPAAGAYSASLELVEGHGIAIDIEDYCTNEFGIRRSMLSVKDAVDKLRRLSEDPELLAEKSHRSREFALPYSWDRVIDQWDALLDRIAHMRSRSATGFARPAARPTKVISQELGSEGASVTVKMIARELGRLESSIQADARRFGTDIRLPAVPAAWRHGNLRVVRDPGLVCAAGDDRGVLERLRQIFPILEARALDEPDDDWYDILAQSILVLNVSGEASADMLTAAAFFGVPCMGVAAPHPQTADLQSALWPELTVTDASEAVHLARILLTDLPMNKRLVDAAMSAARSSIDLDEQRLADRVRAAYARRRAVARVTSG